MPQVCLFLCGDVMPGRGIDQILQHPSAPALYEAYAKSAVTYLRLAEAAHGHIPRRVPPAYVWGDALKLLQTVRPAARIINLETAVTRHDEPWPKGINYRMHPGNVSCLAAAGIDCCVLANNHVLDWGPEGLLETLDVLRDAGLRFVGAGHDAAEAMAPADIPLAGQGRLRVVACAAPDCGVPRDWAATAATPGVNLLPDLHAATAMRLTRRARHDRQAGDVLIASVHWGGNWGYDIPRSHRDFAHALIDGGVDLVHGHSSHHPRGIELYRGKLVLYGCGDFLNDYEGIRGHEEYRADLVLMYLPRIDIATGHLVSMEMVPLQIRQFRLNHASRDEAAWLGDVLCRESARLGTCVRSRSDGHLVINMGGP